MRLTLAANGVTPGINPAATAALGAAAGKYVANDTTTGDGLNTGGFRFNASTPSSFDTYITKLDFNLTEKQTLFVRANYQNDSVVRNALASRYICTDDMGSSEGHCWRPYMDSLKLARQQLQIRVHARCVHFRWRFSREFGQFPLHLSAARILANSRPGNSRS